ncbi:hypothetical protein IM538_21495 [Cytobacillus suaedae]|nr:hypothetical protein IM538_21495 [Cytobacillus suaedae]
MERNDGGHKSSLGVNQEYNRNRYDDIKTRKDYKESYFNGKKTGVDYYSGKILHSDTQAAKRKYGDKSYTKYSADVDHITPLKTIHNDLKRNPFLSDADVQDIANGKYNLRVTNSHLNRSKSHKSNIQVALDSQKELSLSTKTKLMKDEISSKVSISTRSSIKTVQNMGNEFVIGAKNSIEASAIPLAIIGVQNLVSVARGEMDMKVAVKETGGVLGSIALTGGTKEILSIAAASLKNSSSEVLKQLGKSNYVAEIIDVSLMVKDTLISYINGDINGEQFMEKIGENGVSMIASIQGAIIGQALIPIPVVGAFIGSMIASTVCVELYKFGIKMKEAYKSFDEIKELEARVNILTSSALKEMEFQRNKLKNTIGLEVEKWDKSINSAFELLVTSTIADDVEGVTRSFNSILGLFNESVKFKNYEEFDEFFKDENSILTL